MDIQQKIINATIECIAEVGLSKTTSRLIAEKAGINLALINYYFRSKNILINLALDLSLKNAFTDDFATIIKHGKEFEEINYNFLLFLFQGALRYKNISLAIFDFIHQKNESNHIQTINEYLVLIAEQVVQKFPEVSKEEYLLSFSQAMYTIIFSSIYPDAFTLLNHLDFNKIEDQKKYVKHLANKLF